MNPDTENKGQNVSNGFGPERCVELTKGLERAAPESGSIIRARLLSWFRVGITGVMFLFLFVWMFVGQFGTSDNSSSDSDLLIFIIAFLVIYGFVWSMITALMIAEFRELTGGQLNKLYYRIDSLMDVVGKDGERVLASFLVRAAPFGYWIMIGHKPTRGLDVCVFTTHRAFIADVSPKLGGLESMDSSLRLELMFEFDYSSPINFYPIARSTGFMGKYISARFGTKIPGLGAAGTWDFMPIDGNSWYLLEEILRRRSKAR